MLEEHSYQHTDFLRSILDGGDEARSAPVDPQIVESWRRCLADFGLDPDLHRQIDLLAPKALAEIRDRIGPILEIVRVEMANLYEQIADSGYAIVFTDQDGTILECVCDPSLAGTFSTAGFVTGADWSERSGGTNGIGTCLALGHSVSVYLHDHFHQGHIDLICSGSPVVDPYGGMIGVLDATAVNSQDTRSSQKHTMALVNMSANLISNCYFLRCFRDSWVLRFHSRPEFVGLLSESMLAVREDGQILAATASAVDELGYPSRAELQGLDISEVLSVTATMLMERASKRSQVAWPLHQVRNGRRFFVTIRASERPLEGKSPAPARGRVVTIPHKIKASTCETLTGLSIGDPRMAFNVRCAERVMNKSVPILLSGETGTGKEVFSRAIHNASNRAGKPFVAVNCASIPESLIESELFGYKHGAFTGARREGMRGQVLQASGGTLFLDEIGDMPQQLQTRLLRVLEENEVVPLGGGQPVAVDLHVISATHQDLKLMVAEGSFREDLYYRLNGISMQLPPLREREDKDHLIRCALGMENDTGADIAVEDLAFRRLMAYAWPGNIRQLRHVLRTALALCDDAVIRVADLPTEVAHVGPEPVSVPGLPVTAPEQQSSASPGTGNPLEDAEQDAILRELQRNRWNVTNTAACLQMSRNTLYRKMKKYQISSTS